MYSYINFDDELMKSAWRNYCSNNLHDWETAINEVLKCEASIAPTTVDYIAN